MEYPIGYLRIDNRWIETPIAPQLQRPRIELVSAPYLPPIPVSGLSGNGMTNFSFDRRRFRAFVARRPL